VDAENNLLMVRGAVPGANGSVVIVKKTTRIGTKK
jgi:ribosomal protein L3